MLLEPDGQRRDLDTVFSLLDRARSAGLKVVKSSRQFGAFGLPTVDVKPVIGEDKHDKRNTRLITKIHQHRTTVLEVLDRGW